MSGRATPSQFCLVQARDPSHLSCLDEHIKLPSVTHEEPVSFLALPSPRPSTNNIQQRPSGTILNRPVKKRRGAHRCFRRQQD